MGSLLGPVNAGSFITDLERNVTSKLTMHVTKRNRYIDDTVVYIKPVSIDDILSALNSFHKKYQIYNWKRKTQ